MNSDVDRLYLSRKKGGRGLISVKFAIKHEQRNLSFYVHHSDDSYIMQLATNYPLFEEHGRQYKQLNDSECLQTCLSMVSLLERLRNKFQWSWLRFGNLTKEMEGLVFAAQEHAVPTNAIKEHIYCSQSSARCRLCGLDETVDHLVSCCPVLAQREYKPRHDHVASHVHWLLAKQAGFPASDVWWKHTLSQVCENNTCKLLWDFSLVTDASLQHNRLILLWCQSKLMKFI